MQVLRCQGQDTVGRGTATGVPPVHVRDRVPAEAVGASKAGGAPHLVSPRWRCRKPHQRPRQSLQGGCHRRRVRPPRSPSQLRSRGSRRLPRPLETLRGPLSSLWLVKKSRDRKRSGKDRRAESSHRRGHHSSRSPAKRDAGECQIAGCPRRRVPGTVCCCHLCFESGGRRHTKSCDGGRWAGTGSTDPPGPPGSGGGGGDDGKGDGPKKKKKKNRPSQKQRKRRGADEEAGPPAEVKQEDPDYSGEELEELGGLARRLAVKASEAYARGTLASVRSRLRTWDAALRHLEKAGVVKRDPRPGFLTPAVLRKTVAYLCLRSYESAALYGSAALGRHKRHYEVHPSLAAQAAV